MTGPGDPFSLLTMLKERYGVVEQVPPFGPAVIVPNSEYQPGWTDLLNKAGVKAFCGEKAGRVAWIIPLKARPISQAGLKDSRGDKADQPTPIPRESQDQVPGRGCITGRPWTQAEDQQLLTMLDQDKSAAELARVLAPKLDRTERAVKDRVLKLRRQQRARSGPTRPEEKPFDTKDILGSPPEQPAESQQIRSLLESALILGEDPKHRPALRVILQACLRLAQQDQPK